MRFALVLDRFDPAGGGLEQWTAAFAGFLAGREHEVHVIAFEQGEHDLPVTMHLVSAQGGAFLGGRRIAQAVALLAPDAVHDTGTGWSGDVFHPQTGSRRLSQACLIATSPPLARARAAVSPVSMARRWQMAWLERQQVRRARRIVAVSRFVRALLVRQHGLSEATVAVIPNGADVSRFAPSVLDPLRSEARQRIGIGPTTVAFMVSAHNMHLKGVDTAMRSLALLASEGADVCLSIAGGAPDAFWRGLPAQLGIAQRVVFLGRVARMEMLFAAADVLVHPTRWDACSLSTIEAGAAGLPVVTTAMNGAAELLADGQTGFVLPDPEDVAMLASRMRALLDPTLRSRMGHAARLASCDHDIRHNFEATEIVLLAAAAERARGQAPSGLGSQWLNRIGDRQPAGRRPAAPGSARGTPLRGSPG